MVASMDPFTGAIIVCYTYAPQRMFAPGLGSSVSKYSVQSRFEIMLLSNFLLHLPLPQLNLKFSYEEDMGIYLNSARRHVLLPNQVFFREMKFT